MSDQANTQLVQQAYEKVRTGDIPSFLNCLAGDVLWEMPEMPNVPFAGTWRGREGVAQFFKCVNDSQDVVEFKPEEFIAQLDKVVVLGRFTMHVKTTGKESRSVWSHIWTIDRGVVTHMREYVDTLAVSRAHTPTE